MPASPTYWTETSPDGQTTYYCLYCEHAGTEHHSSDLEYFEMHMHQRHDGRMVEGSAPEPDVMGVQAQGQPEHPHGGPPGQTGEHPQGGPPGQGEDHPGHPTPHPEHPIAEPGDAGV